MRKSSDYNGCCRKWTTRGKDGEKIVNLYTAHKVSVDSVRIQTMEKKKTLSPNAGHYCCCNIATLAALDTGHPDTVEFLRPPVPDSAFSLYFRFFLVYSDFKVVQAQEKEKKSF